MHIVKIALLILFKMISGGHPLTCNKSQYEIGERCCDPCPAGSRVEYDCMNSTPTICTPCTERTYTDLPTGKRICSNCTNCDAGPGLKANRSCTTTSDALCGPQEGFHCVASADTGCKAAEKHSSCLPGQFINQTGTALSDTVCSNCTEGTFSNGTFTSCQPHTKCESMGLRLIKPATVSADAKCGGQISNWSIFWIVCGSVSVLCVIMIVLVIKVVRWVRKRNSDHRGKILYSVTRNTVMFLTPQQ